MPAVDSSSLIAFIQGQDGADVELLAASLSAGDAVLAPVVVAEVLSDPELPQAIRATVLGLPTLALSEGFWARAGTTQATVLSKKLRARLADTLIAQSCIDHDAVLI